MFGTLNAFELRGFFPSDVENEISFKVGKVEKNGEHDLDECDELEENFVGKFIKGARKYRGKLPFKCFNCGKLGYYDSRCHIKASRDRPKKNKGKSINKIYYVREDASIFDDEFDYPDDEDDE